MEEKYDYERIHGYTASRFLINFDNTAFRKLVVRIEIKGSHNQCYTIGSASDMLSALLIGACDSTQGRIIEDLDELYNKRNTLGKVIIIFEGNLMREPYPTYEEFWNDIKRD